MGDIIGADIYPWSGLSTAAKPPGAILGQLAVETDTGIVFEWRGAWFPKNVGQDYHIEAAAGNIPNVSTILKFGRATNLDSGVLNDIWDRSNATADDPIWTAPTQARIHAIVSTSTSDDGSPVGVGARTIKIWGLTDWDTAEVNETVTLNGTGAVNTTNSYVIIHRMRVLTKGASGPNVGIITATAATDATVTAEIKAGVGQTGMAIYGVPSTQTLFIGRLYGNMNKSGGAATGIDMQLVCNETPDVDLLSFTTKHTFSVLSTGTSAHTINYYCPKTFVGPCIIKLQGTSGAANIDGSGGFDGILRLTNA